MDKRERNQSFAERLPELIVSAQAGDQQAYTELYEASSQEVYRTARAVLQSEQMALDVQQDTFVYAFSHLDKLRDPKKLCPWLRSIAVNMAKTVLRKQTPVLFTELETDEGNGLPEQADLSPEASPELSLERQETCALVNEILDGLSAGQRAAVGMYYYEQMSVNEIADALGVNAGTVKSQLARGRKKIEEEIYRLEKQGIKLYGLSPIPFLVALMKGLSPSAEAGEVALTKTLAKAGAAAGAKAVAVTAGAGGAASAAEVVAFHVGRSFFETAVGKLVLGVIVAGVIGGGASGYRWFKNHLNREPDPTLPTDHEQLRVIPTAPSVPQESIPAWVTEPETSEDLITEPVTTEPTELPTEPTDPLPTEPTGSKPTEPQPAAPGPGSGEENTQPAEPVPTETLPMEPAVTEPEATAPQAVRPPGEDENSAWGSCGDNLTWTLDKNSGVLTITGSGPMEFIRQPWFDYKDYVTAVILPHGMTHVSEGAFEGFLGLNTVVLPETLTSIGDYAFACCHLTSVAFPNGLTSIGKEAFYDCHLMSLTFPESLKSIGDDAFACCPLTSVVFPDGLTTLGSFAFRDCTELTSVILPASLKNIGEGAFTECKSLTSITLPEGMEIIGEDAFSGTGITSITLPEGLKIIGDDAFCGTGITSITLPQRLTSIGHGAFSYCKNLTSIVIPEGVEEIGWTTFEGCTSLQSVTLPESLKTIGFRAFLDCPALTSVTIPASVTFIDTWSLGYCYRYHGTVGRYETIEGFTIYGVAGSAAQAYAEENKLAFIPQ